MRAPFLLSRRLVALGAAGTALAGLAVLAGPAVFPVAAGTAASSTPALTSLRPVGGSYGRSDFHAIAMRYSDPGAMERPLDNQNAVKLRCVSVGKFFFCIGSVSGQVDTYSGQA